MAMCMRNCTRMKASVCTHMCVSHCSSYYSKVNVNVLIPKCNQSKCGNAKKLLEKN